MRIAFWLFVLWTAALSSFAPLTLFAQSEDPSELFLKAYMAAQQGDKFAKDGRFKEARARLKFATEALQRLALEYPDWQALIVEFRAKKVADQLAEVESRMSLDEVAEEDYQLPSGQSGTPPLVTPETIRPAIPVNPDALPTQPGAPEPFPDDAVGQTRVSGSGPSSMEVIRLKAQIEDLNAELKRTRFELENSADPQDAPEKVKALEEAKSQLEASIEELQTELVGQKEAMEKALAEQKSELEAQLEKQLTAAAEVQKKLEEAERAKEELEKARDAVVAERDAAQKERDAAQKEREAAAEEREGAMAELRAELEAANAKVEKSNKDLEDVKVALETSQAAEEELRQKVESGTEELRAEKKDLATRLTAANLQLAAVAVERDNLEVELDAARKEIERMRTSVEEVTQLRQQNEELLARIQEFEQRFTNLQNDPDQVHRQLEEARTELTSLKQELATTKVRNAESEATIDQLKGQLESLQTELTKAQIAGGNNEEADRIVDENQLLREVVLRQLREERRRTEASKLLMTEVMKLENRSDLLMDKLQEVTEPIIVLSEAERKMFRSPTISISDQDFDTMAVQIALNKPVANPMAAAISKQELPKEDAQPLTTVDGQMIEEETFTGGNASAEETLPDESPAEEAAPPAGPVVETDVKPKVPADLMPLAEEAREYFELGQYRQAEQAYEKILARAPENLYALSNLGVVQFRDGKIRQAELTLKKATKVAPNDAFAHTTLGIIYFKLGKYDEAIEVLTKSITINPRNAQAHNYLGITADMQGWPEAAEEEIQKAIALNPDYADAHFNLAVVYAKQDPPMKELARRHYEKALALGSPPDPLLEKLIN